MALNLANSTIWGITLEFLNFVVFYKLAHLLTTFENHRTVDEHEKHMITKMFTFYYIDCFLWFFLLAFLGIPFGHEVETVLKDWLNIQMDIKYDRNVWKGRLGFAIGAVLSLTQFLMVSAPLHPALHPTR